MIPGMHYNFRDENMYYVDPLLADRNFWKQMLTGDTVDNIPGCPGIGPSKAEKALGTLSPFEMYPVVRAYYVLSYGDEADEKLLEQGRLLWIRRKKDEFWNPPTTTS